MSADNAVRSAIGEAIGYSFAEEAFALVDIIESNVRDGEPGGELHEVAAEIADRIVDLLPTRSLAVLWAILGADGEGFERFGGKASDSTLDRIRLDVFTVVERATHAALEAYANESRTCVHCGRSIRLEDDVWIDPEADGDDIVWRETCDSHDTFEANHEPAPEED